jgi:hypothetical protein
LCNTLIDDFLDRFLQLVEFRRRVVRRDIAVGMSEQRLPCFQWDTGTAESPSEGVTIMPSSA